jgi:hypothetical protein
MLIKGLVRKEKCGSQVILIACNGDCSQSPAPMTGEEGGIGMGENG